MERFTIADAISVFKKIVFRVRDPSLLGTLREQTGRAAAMKFTKFRGCGVLTSCDQTFKRFIAGDAP